MKFNGSFGGWLRQRRKALDLTQAELADQVGCAVVTIRKIEGATVRPSKQIAARLADVLAIPLEEWPAFLVFARHAMLNKPSTLSSSRQQLAELTPFVGRADELSEIGVRLRDPACRLLTLVGPGGIGKTRLAEQAAAECSAEFKDAVCFIGLAPINSADLLVAAIGSALDIAFYGTDEPSVQLINYLRDKHMLLVIDNFEHLLAGVGLLSELLVSCPQVKVLVTSRARLNLREEWAFPIEGLACPLQENTDEAEHYDAVRLFVQSAHRIQPDFSLARNRAAVSAVCRAVEGLPLALELAASWLRVRSCQQIAAEIQDDLDFLMSPLRNVPERHRSLRLAFEQSWQLLSERERAVFAKLSVFRGGFDLDAALQIAGASLRLLADLVDQSLVRLDSDGRYDLHELLRQYASDKLLEMGDIDMVAYRHLEYFIEWAEYIETDLFSSRTVKWYEQLDSDLANIRAALTWALDSRHGEEGLRLASSLGLYWNLRGRFREGQHWLERCLAAAPTARPSARAKGLHRVAYLNVNIGEDHLVERQCEQALALSDPNQDGWNIAWTLCTLSMVRCHQEEFDQAVTLVEQALNLFRKLGHPSGIVIALDILTIALVALGLFERAYLANEEKLVLADEAGEKFAIAWAFQKQCVIVWYQTREPRRVVPCLEASLSRFREVRDKWGIVLTLVDLGTALRAQGDAARAQTVWQEGLLINRELGSLKWLTTTFLAGLGGLSWEQGKPIQAAKLLGSLMGPLNAIDFLWRIERGEYQRDVAAIRAQLGEAAFAAAWAEGQAMTLEQAVTYALSNPAYVG